MFGLGLAEAGEDLVDFDGNPADGGNGNSNNENDNNSNHQQSDREELNAPAPAASANNNEDHENRLNAVDDRVADGVADRAAVCENPPQTSNN